jgi:dihydroflavonol-4-reductase
LNGEGKGQFRIRATVRDINSKEKMGPLESYFGTDLRTKVEFVNADLNNQD